MICFRGDLMLHRWLESWWFNFTNKECSFHCIIWHWLAHRQGVYCDRCKVSWFVYEVIRAVNDFQKVIG